MYQVWLKLHHAFNLYVEHTYTNIHILEDRLLWHYMTENSLIEVNATAWRAFQWMIKRLAGTPYAR